MSTLEASPERPARFRGRNIVLDEEDIDGMTEPPSRGVTPREAEEPPSRRNTPIETEGPLFRGHTPDGTEQPPSRWPTPGVTEQPPSRENTPGEAGPHSRRDTSDEMEEPTSTGDTPNESEPSSTPGTPSEYVQGSSSDSSCDTSGPKRKPMVRMLRLKPQRQVQYRPGKEEGVNLRRLKNCEALLLQTMGEEAESPCARCNDGRGPFEDCVRIPDMLQGCCGNCLYNSYSTECCFHVGRGQDTTARQTTRAFTGKRKAPRYSVSSGSPPDAQTTPRRVTRNSSGHSAAATDRSNRISTTQNATPGSRSLWAADLEYITQQNKRARVLPSLDPTVSDHMDCMRRELRQEMRRAVDKAVDRVRDEIGGQVDLLTQRLDDMGFRHDDDLAAIVRTMRTLAERG